MDNLVKQAYKIFIQKRHDLKLYDGLVDCIKSLSKRFMLGILTNGNADINNFSIGKDFSFSISSLDVKSNKPNIGHFDRALELSGFSASESLHIGDHQINDMLGAMMQDFHIFGLIIIMLYGAKKLLSLKNFRTGIYLRN